MVTKHSPAPWHEVENDDGDVLVKMDESHSVLIGNLEDTCGTCHANARLIAAAPELLEALILADELIGMEPFEHVNNEAADAHYKIRAAIVKAKGEA